MRNKQHHVYARCFGGKEQYLQKPFSGTRYECEKYVRTLAKHGRPTHFLFVSSLDMDAAERRYLD